MMPLAHQPGCCVLYMIFFLRRAEMVEVEADNDMNEFFFSSLVRTFYSFMVIHNNYKFVCVVYNIYIHGKSIMKIL